MVYIWVFIICFSLGYTTMSLIQRIQRRKNIYLLSKREEEFRQYLKIKLDEQSQQGGD